MNVTIPLTSIGGAAPDPAVLQHIAATSRKTLERFVAAAIDALDTVDGDPDLEEDDPCGQADEDGCNLGIQRNALHGRILEGAGCILSDDDADELYKPLWATREGRDFADARRERLGLPPLRQRR